MGNAELASTFVGVLLPALIATVVQAKWPSWVKGIVAALSSIAVGLFIAWLTGDLTGKSWLQSALIVFGAAQAAYKFWWLPTGIGPAIEKATSPEAKPEDVVDDKPKHAAEE
jgi:hypothetical protein